MHIFAEIVENLNNFILLALSWQEVILEFLMWQLFTGNLNVPLSIELQPWAQNETSLLSALDFPNLRFTFASV